MNKLTVIIIVLVVALMSIGIAGAQEPATNPPQDGQFGGRGGRMGSLLEAVSEATGISLEDLRAARENDQTLAEIITANGGDVEAVQAEIVALIVERNPNADAAEVATRVEDFLNNAEPLRENGRGDEFAAIIEEATGLDAQELFQTARDNDQTLAEAIEAAGGDVEAVRTALLAQATANAEERVDNFLNNTPSQRPEGGRGGRGGFGGGQGQGNPVAPQAAPTQEG